MSKSTIDSFPQRLRSQTAAFSSHAGTIYDNGRRLNAQTLFRSYFCMAVVVCLAIQISAQVSIAEADENFGLIDVPQLHPQTQCETCTDMFCADTPSAELGNSPQAVQPPLNLSPLNSSQGDLSVGVVEPAVAYQAASNQFIAQPGHIPIAQSGYVVDQTWAPIDSGFDIAVSMPAQNYAQASTSASLASPSTPPSSSGTVAPGLAQRKAERAARVGIQGHLGGGLGGAKYEGVGWSNQSAQNAIRSCCYWGVRPTAQIGVAKGNDGFWYACVLYF